MPYTTPKYSYGYKCIIVVIQFYWLYPICCYAKFIYPNVSKVCPQGLNTVHIWTHSKAPMDPNQALKPTKYQEGACWETEKCEWFWVLEDWFGKHCKPCPSLHKLIYPYILSIFILVMGTVDLDLEPIPKNTEQGQCHTPIYLIACFG